MDLKGLWQNFKVVRTPGLPFFVLPSCNFIALFEIYTPCIGSSVSLGPHHMTALQAWLMRPTTSELRSYTCTYKRQYTHTKTSYYYHTLLTTLYDEQNAYISTTRQGSRKRTACGLPQTSGSSSPFSAGKQSATEGHYLLDHIKMYLSHRKLYRAINRLESLFNLGRWVLYW
jgi:hypothetical protein